MHCRSGIGETFVAFGPIWKQQISFARLLLRNLVQDLRQLSGSAAVSSGSSSRGADEPELGSNAVRSQNAKLLGLACCVAAIAEAAPAATDPELLQQALGCFAVRLRRPPAPETGAVVELLASAGQLATAADMALAKQSASSGAAAAAAPSAEAIFVQLAAMQLDAGGERVSVQLSTTQTGGRAAPKNSPAVLQIYEAAADFIEAALSMPGVAARPAALAPALHVQLTWLRFLQQHTSSAAMEAAASRVMHRRGGALLRLRDHSSTVLLQPLAKLLVFLLQQSAAATDALLSDAATLARAEHAEAQGEGAAALLFSLRLLHKALPMLPPARAMAVWTVLGPAAMPASPLAASNQPLWLELLQVLHAASSIAVPQGPEVAAEVLLLMTEVLLWQRAEESVLLHALRWLQQMAAALPADMAASAGGRAALVGALAAAGAAAESDHARLREVALHALAVLASRPPGSAALLADPQAAAELYQRAAMRLADLSGPVAQAAQELVVATAAVLALRGSLATPSPPPPDDRLFALAVQPQQHGFAPPQLQQLLSFLMTAAESPGASGAPESWLPCLLASLPELPVAASTAGFEGPGVTSR